MTWWQEIQRKNINMILSFHVLYQPDWIGNTVISSIFSTSRHLIKCLKKVVTVLRKNSMILVILRLLFQMMLSKQISMLCQLASYNEQINVPSTILKQRICIRRVNYEFNLTFFHSTFLFFTCQWASVVEGENSLNRVKWSCAIIIMK